MVWYQSPLLLQFTQLATAHHLLLPRPSSLVLRLDGSATRARFQVRRGDEVIVAVDKPWSDRISSSSSFPLSLSSSPSSSCLMQASVKSALYDWSRERSVALSMMGAVA